MEEYLSKARSLEEYFLRLWDESKEPQWRVGLEASQKWLSLLEQRASVEQIQLFFEYLNRESVNHGSGWADLRSVVNCWLYSHGVDT